MENVNTVNNISAELMKEVKAAMPKKGQTVFFTSIRPNARGTTVHPVDRIYDPYAGRDESGEYVGDYIDIAYIVGREPGKAGSRPVDIMGRIQFNKRTAGRMGISAGNKEQEQLFTFLYLTNQLRNNGPSKDLPDGKPWFVHGKQQIFYMEEPEKTASQKIEDNRKVRQAQQAIDDMPESQLRDFAIGLEMKGITSTSSPDEIRVKLLGMAGSVAGAARVLSLDKDAALQVKIDIKAAEKAGVIVKNTGLGVWEWADGGTVCVIAAGVNPYEALIPFFLGKGSAAYKTMKVLIAKPVDEKQQEPKVEAPKPGRPKKEK